MGSNSLSLLLDVREGQDAEHAVVNYLPPEELYKVVDFALPDQGAGVEGMVLLLLLLSWILLLWWPEWAADQWRMNE